MDSGAPSSSSLASLDHGVQKKIRRDYRPIALFGVCALIGGLGFLVQIAPGKGVEARTETHQGGKSSFEGLRAATGDADQRNRSKDEVVPPADSQAPDTDLARALEKADKLIDAKKYDQAIRTMNNLHPLPKASPHAYDVIGRALLGKGDFQTARDFFSKAIDLDPTFAEAYFDHATASEGLGELDTALGGMRSYLHLEPNNDPHRLKIAQARSAIWEWEAKLGRGPWGPTKGIPPGFTTEMLKRDGNGVGTLMPKPETLRPDGTMDFEIKSGERQLHLWKQ